jgi:hypothetical protein
MRHFDAAPNSGDSNAYLNWVGDQLTVEDAMSEATSAKLCDLGNLILGTILIVSPWMFANTASTQSDNAYASGLFIIALSIAALTFFTAWAEWLVLIVGIWLIVAPWVLNFQGIEAARVEITIGIVIAVFAKNGIWFRSQLNPNPVIIPENWS